MKKLALNSRFIAALALFIAGNVQGEENGAPDAGVREILAAVPAVYQLRWAGTLHDPNLGDEWVFYDSQNIKTVVPKDVKPEGLLESIHTARDAVLIWLVQQRNPDFKPHRSPDAGLPTAAMDVIAYRCNKLIGDLYTVRPISTYTDKDQAESAYENTTNGRTIIDPNSGQVTGIFHQP
jgi:hypothetical protein